MKPFRYRDFLELGTKIRPWRRWLRPTEGTMGQKSRAEVIIEDCMRYLGARRLQVPGMVFRAPFNLAHRLVEIIPQVIESVTATMTDSLGWEIEVVPTKETCHKVDGPKIDALLAEQMKLLEENKAIVELRRKLDERSEAICAKRHQLGDQIHELVYGPKVPFDCTFLGCR